MTQEEKLEEAKKLYKDANADQRYVLERLFPELKDKESEDERIRKAIHIYLDWLDGRKDYAPRGEYTIKEMNTWLEKQGEQKPADKVEPKFNLYDWVVTDKGDTVQIRAVNNGYYTIGNGMDFNTSYVDRCWNKWTIQDAKDGDVLADKITSLPSPFIAIFKKKDSVDTFSSHCFIGFDGKFYEGEDEHSLENLHPATKEQLDTLMKEMADAGYTFDFDKKELKKIEQKPAWSEEDEEKFSLIRAILIDAKSPNNCTSDSTYYREVTESIEWLKSLKDRCSWRPSDEQRKVLFKYADQNNYDGSVLTSLYQDLTKLKGE